MNMKNFITCLTFILTGLVCSYAYPSDETQDDSQISRKERRMARRENRMQAQALKDSIMLLKHSNEEINVGYGRIKRRNLTTSVSKVPVNTDLMGSYTHIGEYLRGRVPGLVVSKNGTGYSYSIRGINSIYGSTEPLFIVDGVEVSDIDHLNPRDVESVEVLKDASASIYGTRGACGVILITTKK